MPGRSAAPLLLLVSAFLAGCSTTETTWYQFEPVQCGGNPWDPVDGQVLPSEEEAAVRQHYAEQGVTLGRFATTRIADATPAACGIMRGDRLYVTIVSGEDQVLLADGWHAGPGPDADPDVRKQSL